MSYAANIHYLQQHEIDKTRWDACISSSANGLIYACSSYLDTMSKNWDALVLRDYEAVMPLTWNKKYGVYYLYQPAFTASLGIFGNNISAKLTEDFIGSIPKKFRLIEIALNAGNMLPNHIFASIARHNYTLSLNKNYGELHSAYRDHIKRNVRKAQQLGCTVKKNISIEEVINLSKPVMQFTGVKDEDYIKFKQLYHYLLAQNKAAAYGTYSPDNQLVASCAYFFSHKRAYYIIAGNHPNSKTIGASHYLIDAFIKEHSSQDILLDFEGSDISNLAFFYSSFGAKLETYPFLKINNLPFWAKWIK